MKDGAWISPGVVFLEVTHILLPHCPYTLHFDFYGVCSAFKCSYHVELTCTFEESVWFLCYLHTHSFV